LIVGDRAGQCKENEGMAVAASRRRRRITVGSVRHPPESKDRAGMDGSGTAEARPDPGMDRLLENVRSYLIRRNDVVLRHTLAHRFEKLIRDGEVRDYADLARLTI
jgi:hypothetical protein